MDDIRLFRIRFFLAVVLTTVSCSLYSQRLIFDNIGVDGGLPATEAYHVFQDKKGYVWCFTEYGIVKHNGRSFVPSCKNLDLEHSAIYAVAENTNGELYIANSKAEVYQVINDKAYKVYGLESMTKDIVKLDGFLINIFFGDNGTIHICSFTRHYKFLADEYWTKGRKNSKKIFKKRKKPEIYPYLVRKNLKNPLQTGYNQSLRFFSTDRKRYPNWFKSKKFGYWMLFRRNRNGDYLSMMREIARYNGKENYLMRSLKNEILDMEISDNGHVWVATNNDGLWEFDKDLNPLNHYFEKTIISDILFDNQNGMWLTSVGEGVFHCKNIHRNSFWNNPELSGGISRIEKLNNHLFVGTMAGSAFVNCNGTLEKIDIGKPILPVYDFEYSDNRYFVGSAIMFYTLNRHFKVERKIKDSCYAYSICKFGKHLLLGEHAFVFDYNPENGNYKIVFKPGKPRNFEPRNAREIFFTDNHNTGILVNDKPTFPVYLHPLQDKRISCIKMDRKGNTWFCTKGYGLYRLTPDNHLFHVSGTPANIINDIRFISGNRIILSTNKGAFLSRVHLNKKEFSWERILYEEVICAEEMAGKIYFGTKRGLIVSGTDELFQRSNVKFYLNSVYVNSKKSTLSSVASLNYNENELAFNYDFLNYHLTEAKMAYRLTGPTSLKGSVSDNKIHFQNLPPGEYVLKVSPMVDFDSKDKLEIVTKIAIRPAFWQTGLFQSAILILMAALLIVSVGYFISRKSRRQRAKDEIEKLVTEHRLTALKAQVNPHFMSNSMVAIQRLIMEGNTDSANLYLAKFSWLLRSLLDYSSKSAASLQKELEMISLYVELEQLRFNHHFSFEIDVDEKVDLAKTFIPSLFTQPFVENAIWHGLLPLKMQRTPKLMIRIFNEGDLLVISICDNGVGRGTNVSKDPLRKSHGSQLMLDRIEGMNKLYNTNDGGVKYIDIVDDKGEPAGTDVLIYFPEKILQELAKEVMSD